MTIILTEMCKRVGANFNDIYWKVHPLRPTDFLWTSEEQDNFKDWLVDYLRKLKVIELKELAEYPSIIYRNKKRSIGLANEFIMQYGWSIKEITV